MMQQGMAGIEGLITPEDLPSDTLIGRLQLVVLGIIITIFTQSSSAGAAATLTVLYAGAIYFEQAAALVIGMDVGTTVTAANATIGGSVGACRTGFSHVIYNLLTGIGALILITPFTLVWEKIAPGQLVESAEIALVAFHTTFNTLGMIIILPFTYQFARLMEKLVPGKAPTYTDRLDRSLLDDPGLALTAIQHTIYYELLGLLGHINAILGNTKYGKRIDLINL